MTLLLSASLYPSGKCEKKWRNRGWFLKNEENLFIHEKTDMSLICIAASEPSNTFLDGDKVIYSNLNVKNDHVWIGKLK